MTEKEFDAQVTIPNMGEPGWFTQILESARRAAKEAGATFDPEPPPEPEVVWSSERDLDGWEERLLANGRWQMRKVERDIEWFNQGCASATSPIRKKLGELLLARYEAALPAKPVQVPTVDAVMAEIGRCHGFHEWSAAYVLEGLRAAGLPEVEP